jgi:hypothetical protein
MSLSSTFLFRFFPTTSGDPHQFLVGQVFKVVVLPGVTGLLCRRQFGLFERLLVKIKINSSGGNVSGYRLVGRVA